MFSCQDGDNLSVTKSGELLYFVATVVVIYNKAKETQRYYVKHTEDVMCMDVHLSKNIVNSLTFAKKIVRIGDNPKRTFMSKFPLNFLLLKCIVMI